MELTDLLFLKFYSAGNASVKRVIARAADIGASGKFSPALADNNAARVHALPAVNFYAQIFRSGISAQTSAGTGFFMSHRVGTSC